MRLHGIHHSRQIEEDGRILIFVIPAKAGIQGFESFLDSRLRGSDNFVSFENPAHD
jgi:hypothetical protein